ncbi:flagellar biosynthetic protein FliR [Frigidibacter sp. MR17.24]|uniref:flagellar biosynthetic protein FliR n=1 Tax=Frigidibacter sp. MR17.24 TaxID=3127345 RepID=UPI0030130477
MDPAGIISAQVFGWMLVFARIGSALMFLPGFGETQITIRARLMFGIILTLVLYPASPVPAMLPGDAVQMAQLIGTEALIGLWIGSVARTILSALDFAGYQAGYATGLANAFSPSLGSFEGATAVASFLLMSATALIFVTNLHHVMLRSLMFSYEVFPFGTLMPGDLADQFAKALAGSLYIGVTLAAPFFVMGLLINLGLGLANRMMASLPVFFVAGSVLTGAGFLVLAFAAPAMLHGFLDRLADWLGTFRF